MNKNATSILDNLDLSDDLIGYAGMAYVLDSLDAQPIPPNGFSRKGMRAAIIEYHKRLQEKENEQYT